MDNLDEGALFRQRQQAQDEAEESKKKQFYEKLRDQLGTLIPDAIANLKHHNYPMNPPNAMLMEVNGRERIAWFVASYASYSTQDTLYLLTDGSIVTGKGSDSLEYLSRGHYFYERSIKDIVEGFERLKNFTPKP